MSGVPTLVAPSKSPLLVLEDFYCLSLRVDYAKAVPGVDSQGPPPPRGHTAGYTAPLSRFVETSIVGLTSEPVLLHGEPAPGEVFHYLVRAENDCPSGQGALREGAGCP